MNEAVAVLGGPSGVASMVATALTPAVGPPRMADAHWVAQTADRVLAAMEETRSTWQMWHVRAEAQRHVRAVEIGAEQANPLVDLLIDEVLEHRSVALAAPPDGIEEPGALRRVDGSSVYSILDAEQRLLTVAGIRDGTVIDCTVVDVAVLEMAANGTAWMWGRPRWSGRCAPLLLDYSWRSPPPAQGRPRPCAPSPWPGPTTAASCSASPHPLPQPLALPSKPASVPTLWPN
jgi:hypothetical protein